MIYHCQKLYNGYASIRDYLIDLCIIKKEDLVIKYKDDEMIVPLEQLQNPHKFQIHKTPFESKYRKGQSYELYDFKFKSQANKLPLFIKRENKTNNSVKLLPI